jgi:hypothetical protein
MKNWKLSRYRTWQTKFTASQLTSRSLKLSKPNNAEAPKTSKMSHFYYKGLQFGSPPRIGVFWPMYPQVSSVTSGKYWDRKLKLWDGRFLPDPLQIMNIVPPLKLLMSLSLNKPQTSDLIQINHHIKDDDPRCDGNEFKMLFLPIVRIS